MAFAGAGTDFVNTYEDRGRIHLGDGDDIATDVASGDVIPV